MANFSIVKGNLLEADAMALVNTVNTVGVMGKGIALQFKNRYKKNYKEYKDACKAGAFTTGQVLTVLDGDLMNQRYIINFPTKAHWRAPSKLSYISSGLSALVAEIKRLEIPSIAMPPLGCGNGGLDWATVKPMIIEALEPLDIEVILYEPNTAIKAQLQKEETKKEVKLTDARAMLLYLMFQYEAAGEQSSLFVANKLAYFLQRKGEKLRLKFEAHHYGPYAVQLNHVLLYLNGTYLKGVEQNEVKPFEPLLLNYNRFSEVQEYVQSKLSTEQRARLEEVIQLISRFESSFALELLASVEYIRSANETKTVEDIYQSLKQWNRRKANMFNRKEVEIAIDHLSDHTSSAISHLA